MSLHVGVPLYTFLRVLSHYIVNNTSNEAKIMGIMWKMALKMALM